MKSSSSSSRRKFLKLIRFFLPVAILLILFSCNKADKTWTIGSPGGSLKVMISIEGGGLFYNIISQTTGGDSLVLLPSPLGLVRNDANFFKNLKVDSLTKIREVSDSYTMITGKQRNLAYRVNQAILVLKNKEGKQMNIVFRVFDEGVAFRYQFPEKSDSRYTVVAEKTGFKVPETSEGWMSPYEPSNGYGQPGYEKDYLAVKAGETAPDSIGWAFPLLFRNENHWIMISESGLDGTYCGSHLDNARNSSLYSISFPLANERFGEGEVDPSSTLPWTLPWRYILVGKSVSEVYESSMMYHLAEPSKLKDVSWIKPGRSSWEWWSSTSGRNVKNLKKFIDLAVEMHWEYSLIDGGWRQMPKGSLRELVSYAKSKNVGLTLWYNSGGRRDKTQKDEDFVMFNSATREKEMARLEALGIKGIKVDFFASDKQFIIQLYLDILHDAAKHHLLVVFHGCTLPRGWARTYPNLMSMEAVRGAECYRFSKTYPEIAARYNTTAAVVRGFAGPTDYTPVTLTNQKYPHKTTAAFELALAVVYESGIIHFADCPKGYLALPTEVQTYLKQLPSVWDETKLIASIPGELFVIARRKGSHWFIAGINGKDEIQKFEFYPPGKLSQPVLITDGQTQNDVNIKTEYSGLTFYSIQMKPMGGFVIFSPHESSRYSNAVDVKTDCIRGK